MSPRGLVCAAGGPIFDHFTSVGEEKRRRRARFWTTLRANSGAERNFYRFTQITAGAEHFRSFARITAGAENFVSFAQITAEGKNSSSTILPE